VTVAQRGVTIGDLNVPRNGTSFGLLTPILAVNVLFSVFFLTPATAEFSGYSVRTSLEFAAQSTRPRVTVYPRSRKLKSSAKRHCHVSLVTENRASGPVIVPRQQCWWQ